MRRIDQPDDDYPLWQPAEDGWDVTEWGHDDPGDPPSLYTERRQAAPPD